MTSSKSPVKILYVCHDGDLYGSQQSLKLMLSYLPAEQFTSYVSIARPGPLNEVLQTELPEVTVLSHRRLQWIKHDLRHVFQKVGDIIGLLVAGLPRAMHLANIIKHHGIQLVHTNSVVSLEGALAAKLAGVPHVWHIRELFMEESPKIQTVLGKTLTRWLVHRLSHRVICISKAVQQQFLPYLNQSLSPSQMRGNKFEVVYNALAVTKVENSRTVETSKNGTFHVGYIGRLSSGKRFQDLLDAVARLDHTAQPLKLMVAGHFVDAPFQKMIEDRLDRLELRQKVDFLGQLDLEEISLLYKKLDVLVVPSLNEPFGRVVIESMLAGVPCIGANSGGIPEIVTDNETGMLFAAKDVDALAAKLQQAMAQPAYLKTIRDNAGRMVRERFTIDSQMATLVSCYDMLLDN